jgi:uncharacterized protein (DUF1778 family)
MSTPTKVSRIDLRVNLDQKELLERAAMVKGLSLSAYLLSCSLEAAQADIAATEHLVLSDVDRDLFLQLTSEPPSPEPALIDAMAEFQAKYEAK